MLRTRALVFCALYLVAIAYLSLFPFEFRLFPKAAGLIWVPLTVRRQILDAVLNFFFYVPFGASFVAIVRGRSKSFAMIAAAAIVGGAISWTIEWLQLWTPSRYSTYNDLVTNVVGTLCGATAASLILNASWWPATGRSSAAKLALDRSGGLLLGLWILWRAFPFVPRISLVGSLASFRAGLQISWVSAADALFGFTVVALAVRQPAWRMAALALVPAQIAFRGQDFSLSALFGALIGWALVDRPQQKIWAVLFPVYLAIAEFRPFHLATELKPIAWQPFGSIYDSGDGSYQTLFGKLLLYTGTVWVMRQRFGWGRSLGVPLAIVVTGEWAQQYLPGRTPETTDVVLLLAGALLIRLTGSDALQTNQFGVKGQQNQVEGA